MTMNSTGPLSLGGTTAGQSAEIELGMSGTAAITMNDSNIRTLAGAGSTGTAWSMNLLYSKSSLTPGGWYSFGDNSSGQLGDSTIVSKSTPVQIGAATTWASVTTGEGARTFMVNSAGAMYAAGRNLYGELGIGSVASASSPTVITHPLGGTWKSVATGGFWSYAIDTSARLWACGYNNYGAVGDGTIVKKSTFVQIGSANSWAQVSTGTTGSSNTSGAIAIDTSGRLWSWGPNLNGRLGIGQPDTAIYSVSTPVQVGSATNWKMVSNGSNHWMGIQTDGTLWACGANTLSSSSPIGQLGFAGPWVYANISTPVQVQSATDWSFTAGTQRYGQLATGVSQGAAIKQDGTMWTWGNGTTGQLGNGTTTTWQQYPAQIGAPSGGGTWSQTCGNGAVSSTGGLYMWGTQNTTGTLGTGNALNYSTPTLVVGGASGWSHVTSDFNSTAAIKTNGTLWTWGRNDQGQLGIGVSGPSPGANWRSAPTQVGAATNWVQVDMGNGSLSCAAINSLGQLWTWGYNTIGQLGIGTVANALNPTQVGTLTNWKYVSQGYTCLAIKTDGTMWGWGSNNAGQIGDGTLVSRSSPVQVGSRTDWKYCSGSGTGGTSAAIDTSGRLWTWGQNNYGQLGIGSATNASTPVQVGSFTDWLQVATDGIVILATRGTSPTISLYSFGFGTTNQRANSGIGTPDVSTPVQIGSATNWVSVSCGYMSSSVINSSNQLFVTGYNGYGELGIGNLVNVSTLTQVPGTWKTSRMTRLNGGAINTAGQLFLWGNNGTGQLGNASIVATSSPVQVGALTTWTQFYIGAAQVIGIHS